MEIKNRKVLSFDNQYGGMLKTSGNNEGNHKCHSRET